MTASKPPKVAGILLAAGGSARLGEPKQFLQFRGKSLLRNAAEALIGSGCGPVVVVVARDDERIAAELKGLAVLVVPNEDWQTGMSSSIRAGLARLIPEAPDGVLIALCDQPHVDSAALTRFVRRFRESGTPVIAAGYHGIAGVPALFSRDLFGELSRLEGDKGARHLIRTQPNLETIDLPEAAFDIDTPEDAVKLDG